jgi:hypothetical protein
MVPGMTVQQTAVLGYSVLVLQECLFDQHGLEKFIIVQPQSLVNILRSFITDEHFWPDDESLRDILRAMIITGEIAKKDLLKLWSPCWSKYKILPKEC